MVNKVSCRFVENTTALYYWSLSSVYIGCEQNMVVCMVGQVGYVELIVPESDIICLKDT